MERKTALPEKSFRKLAPAPMTSEEEARDQHEAERPGISLWGRW
jgi:hypothetical protein